MSGAKVCQCSACTERKTHGLQALRLLSNHDNDNTSALTSKFAVKIFKSYYVVKHVNYRFMNILAERWAAMGPDSRKEFLRSVCPNIPEGHRPDLLYLRQPSKKGSIQRQAFDSPQINLEDLCHDDALMGFISSRGLCPPGDFMMLDADNGSLNPFVPHFNAARWNYMMVICGQNTAETYGQIKSLDVLEAEGKVHLGDIPPLGLYTLQIQTSIMAFLENCCRKLLPELDSENIEEKNTALTAAQRLNNGGWLSTRFLVPNPAYLPPGSMRLAELTYLAEGRFLAAEDHICSLIADPEYLLATVVETSKHYPRMNEDLLAWGGWLLENSEKGERHNASDKLLAKRTGPVLKKLLSSKSKKANTTAAERLFWAKICNWVIGDAHLQLLFWVRTSDHLHAIKDLLFSCNVDEDATRLPRNVENAFRRLELITITMKDTAYGSLGMGLPASKELRHLYRTETEGRADRMTIKTAVLTGKRMTNAEWRVHHTFRALYGHGGSFHSEYALQDEVRQMMKTDPKAAELVSEWNADQVLNISTCLTIIRELDHFQPWVLGWRHQATFEHMQNEHDALRTDMMAIKNAATACGLVHPILPNNQEMQYSYAPTSGKLREEIKQTCAQFINSFYSYLAEALGGKNPFISDLERLMRKLGVDQSRGAHSELAQAMAQMALTDTPTPSTPPPPEPEADDEEDNIHNIVVSPHTAKVIRTIAELRPEDRTTSLAFEDFRQTMEELGFDAFEMCWPGWLFYPRKDSHMVRPLFCRSPHAKGGKWTASQIRLIRGRFCTLSRMLSE